MADDTSQPAFDKDDLPQHVQDRIDLNEATWMHELSEANHRQALSTRSLLLIELAKAQAEFNGATKTSVSPAAGSHRSLIANIALEKIVRLGTLLNEVEEKILKHKEKTTVTLDTGFDGEKVNFTGTYAELDEWAKENYWPKQSSRTVFYDTSSHDVS